MPRTVRISPVPIPPPPVPARPRRRHDGVIGAGLLVVAFVLALGHVLLAGRGEHSYDRNPTPPSTVRLTAGVQYLVSTVDGPGAVQAVAPLACTATAVGGAATALTVTAEAADSRATHAVGSFVAPASGVFTVTCSGGAAGDRAVFVDDADDAGTDLAGWLLVLTVVAGVAGAGLGLGALYRRFGAPSDGAPAGERVSGVTADPAA